MACCVHLNCMNEYWKQHAFLYDSGHLNRYKISMDEKILRNIYCHFCSAFTCLRIKLLYESVTKELLNPCAEEGRNRKQAKWRRENPPLSLDSFLHFFRESAKISQKRFTVNGHVRGLSLNAIMDSALILFGQPANMYINMCKNTLYTHQPFMSNCPRIQQLTVSKKYYTHSTFLDVSWAL